MLRRATCHKICLLVAVTVVAVGLDAPHSGGRVHAATPQEPLPPIALFRTLGDRVHESSTPPPEMSAHAWWLRISGPATLARVTVQIQQYYKGGWVSVGRRGVGIVRSGGGAGNRVTARARCHHYKGGIHRYWSVVDVDLLGHRDTPEKLNTPPVTSRCSYLGRDT
jgi:hypothetical protein